jgi:hypothetical protein
MGSQECWFGAVGYFLSSLEINRADVHTFYALFIENGFPDMQALFYLSGNNKHFVLFLNSYVRW